MAQRITQVDAFTSEPFRGNPAAVCVLDVPRDEQWMQDVAREMNLAETAFLVRDGEAYALRWFTPMIEVDLCGHATLASAHVLWQDGHLGKGDTARFHTRSGLLTATRDDGWITMDFPAELPQPVQTPRALVEALGLESVAGAARNRLDDLIEVESEDIVRAVTPDFRRLRDVIRRGVIVTAPSRAPTYDFVSRYFAPAVGIDEDPVTGSAHCCLGPYWSDRFGRQDLVGYQASARGGVVRVQHAGDRVLLAGQAVTVLRAELVDDRATDPTISSPDTWKGMVGRAIQS